MTKNWATTKNGPVLIWFVTVCFHFCLWSSKSRDVYAGELLLLKKWSLTLPSESTGLKSHFEGQLTEQCHLKAHPNQKHSFSLKQHVTLQQWQRSGKENNTAWGSRVLQLTSWVSLVLSWTTDLFVWFSSWFEKCGDTTLSPSLLFPPAFSGVSSFWEVAESRTCTNTRFPHRRVNASTRRN